MREKTKIYVSMYICSLKLHNFQEIISRKRLNKIERVKNIMRACQGVNLLLFIMIYDAYLIYLIILYTYQVHIFVSSTSRF
jgi:hypothetical protein